MESRNAAFQELKPVCVMLSQTLLAWSSGKGNTSDVLKHLTSLNQVLRHPIVYKALDEKLADYVFFPVSNALRQLEQLPIRARELTLEVISILLETAWKSKLNPDLGIQLMILLTFILDSGVAHDGSSIESEDLDQTILLCLSHIFSALRVSPGGKNALLSTAHVPQIGKTLSTILSSINGGSTGKVRVAALGTLDSFRAAWPDQQSMSLKFFPGIISSLTKILSPKPSEKVLFRTLKLALEILSNIMVQTLSDQTLGHLVEIHDSEEASTEALSKSWLTATAGQIKLALSSIMKLRTHEDYNTRHRLAGLCLACLENCWTTLADCREMLLESLVIIATKDDKVICDLKRLMVTQETVSTNLRTSLYNNILALPRTMLSSDDLLRKRTLDQVSLIFSLLHANGIDLSMVESILATNIRDSIVHTALHASNRKYMIDETDSGPAQQLVLRGSQSLEYQEVLSTTASQKHILQEITALLSTLSTHDQSLNVVRELLAELYSGSAAVQVASLWACLHLLRAAVGSSLNDVIAFDGIDGPLQNVMDELYSFSLDILRNSDHVDQDWKLRALSLEVIVLQAQYHKQAFRVELIDCLYPVAQTMGSTNSILREHAVTSLNLLANHCGYRNSSDMMIANVDYLVNAVALRLNTFDLSPQAPQILLMMVKLAGPSLLPFLDDLVDSMFAILDSFHGYPKLVEFLFEVLKAIADEGAKAHPLQLQGSADTMSAQAAPTKPLSISELRDVLTKRKSRMKTMDSPESEISTKPPPNLEQLWAAEQAKSNKRNSLHSLAEGEFSDSDDLETDAGVPATTSDDTAAVEKKIPKTYSLLLSIARLTQHYLTSYSLELRIKLLSLLETTIPVLAQDDDSFLPLINTLWPVILPRLRDAEDFVVAGALDVIALLCFHAKGFMSSRVEEAWSDIMFIGSRCSPDPRAQPKIRRGTAHQATVPLHMKGLNSPRSQFAKTEVNMVRQFSSSSKTRIWTSFVHLLTSIMGNVRLGDHMSETIVDVLLPALNYNKVVEKTLMANQPDALWLALKRCTSLNAGADVQNDQDGPASPQILSRPVDTQWPFASIL